MKQTTIVFGGTIRDVEKYIETSLQNIDRCGQKFKDYSVILYENDSKDRTRSILQALKRPNYHYIFEDSVKEPHRTERLARGRNKILDKLREINQNDAYEYFVMIDLDDVNSSGMFVETIESCFQVQNWDVLTGNQSNRYYDLWALRKKHDMEYDCWKKVKEHSDDPDAIEKYVYSKFPNYPVGQLLEVDSAFGGIAIYRIRAIPDSCNYIGLYDDGNLQCEHVPFHKCIKDNGGSIFINTSFLTS